SRKTMVDGCPASRVNTRSTRPSFSRAAGTVQARNSSGLPRRGGYGAENGSETSAEERSGVPSRVADQRGSTEEADEWGRGGGAGGSAWEGRGEVEREGGGGAGLGSGGEDGGAHEGVAPAGGEEVVLGPARQAVEVAELLQDVEGGLGERAAAGTAVFAVVG